jgi:hypothetical protein
LSQRAQNALDWGEESKVVQTTEEALRACPESWPLSWRLQAGLTLVFAMTSGSSRSSKAHFAQQAGGPGGRSATAERRTGRRMGRGPHLGGGPGLRQPRVFRANKRFRSNLTLHAQGAWAGVKARGAARGPEPRKPVVARGS